MQTDFDGGAPSKVASAVEQIRCYYNMHKESIFIGIFMKPLRYNTKT